jgi:transcription termination factor Rho
VPVLDRSSLEQSPLADLHAIASELSIDGYRRLRKEELIDAILSRQGGETPEAPEDAEAPAGRRRRSRRGGRGRSTAERAEAEEEEEEEEESEDAEPAVEDHEPQEEAVEGVVELLPGGSAFMRVNPPEHSDDDIYISAAQVKRCELVTGDRVAGPRRPPRRSERFASLVQIDTINGRPAAELADSARFDDLPAAFPAVRLAVASDEPSLQALMEHAPIGLGSRVTIAGPAQSGKSELLRRLSVWLSGQEDVQTWLVLAGVRPEELPEWRAGPVAPAAAVSLTASSDAQGQAVEGVVEQARRMAARGAHAVVLIDTLEAVPALVARRSLAAARKIVDGGSLTVIATRSAPLGGETTVVALAAARARAGSFPSIDPEASWTMRRELLA